MPPDVALDTAQAASFCDTKIERRLKREKERIRKSEVERGRKRQNEGEKRKLRMREEKKGD